MNRFCCHPDHQDDTQPDQSQHDAQHGLDYIQGQLVSDPQRKVDSGKLQPSMMPRIMKLTVKNGCPLPNAQRTPLYHCSNGSMLQCGRQMDTHQSFRVPAEYPG